MVNNVNYFPQYKFDDCRDVLPLPFDFYIPSKNVCIEFDGQHHYYDLPGWANHDITVKHDIMKSDFCEKSGIRLIRIPFWDGHNIDGILNKELL